MCELLLGWHLRIIPELLDQWDSSRREDFLIKENINIPLSVDTSVWPICINEEIQASLFEGYSPGKYNVQNGLNLFNLRSQTVLEKNSCYENCLLIAITVMDNECDHFSKIKNMHGIDTVLTFEHIYQAGWYCIGYDVADYWLCSGLMNCGIDKTIKYVLSERYSDNINNDGLFKSFNIAQSYCINCDLLFPDHSPFAIYGIWAKKIAGCGSNLDL